VTSPELRLTAPVREELLAHARAASPAEACGVLVGTRGDASDRPDAVREVRRVDNVAAGPRSRYELDPEATLAAIERVEAAGDDLVGFYHSHPHGLAEPSATDRRRATWAGYVYCIVVPEPGDDGGGSGPGAESGTVRAWRWTGEAFDPLAVAVGDG
jgi:proteasome lid subunit RPN8/RPN11